MVGEIDYYSENSDWLHRTWTMSPYKSSKFMDEISAQGTTIEEFKTTRMYVDAVRDGLIVNDEWTGMIVDWNEPWFRNIDIATQVDVRMQAHDEEITGMLADAQDEAGRALTREETGMYISQYINDSTISMMDSADIIVGDADIGGIEGIMQLDQGLAWFTALSAYSSNMVDVLIGMGLPQIWSKRGARSTYYKDRNLIIIPELTRNGAQLLAHAVAHYVEHIGENLKAVEYVRNGMAFPGKLVMIRDGLYALDGPWLDMFDGVLRHDTGRLESLYIQGYEFSEQEINKMFTGMPTEFFPMMAQRVIRRDPVELSALWARVKKQLLLYLTVSDGNYIGSS